MKCAKSWHIPVHVLPVLMQTMEGPRRKAKYMTGILRERLFPLAPYEAKRLKRGL